MFNLLFVLLKDQYHQDSKAQSDNKQKATAKDDHDQDDAVDLRSYKQEINTKDGTEQPLSYRWGVVTHSLAKEHIKLLSPPPTHTHLTMIT